MKLYSSWLQPKHDIYCTVHTCLHIDFIEYLVYFSRIFGGVREERGTLSNLCILCMPTLQKSFTLHAVLRAPTEEIENRPIVQFNDKFFTLRLATAHTLCLSQRRWRGRMTGGWQITSPHPGSPTCPITGTQG